MIIVYLVSLTVFGGTALWLCAERLAQLIRERMHHDD